ncbi:hypothetical protein JXO59_01105 [candidate division KSB1 bacterium]|nr:hypothetical protein [candidate division KSB1 bacterium]
MWKEEIQRSILAFLLIEWIAIIEALAFEAGVIPLTANAPDEAGSNHTADMLKSTSIEWRILSRSKDRRQWGSGTAA